MRTQRHRRTRGVSTARAFVLFAVATAAALVVTLGYAANRLTDVVVADESRDQVFYSSHLASVAFRESIQQVSGRVARFGDSFSVQDAVGTRNRKLMRAYLDQLQERSARIRTALIADARGQLVLASPPRFASGPEALTARRWYQAAERGVPLVSDTYEVLPPGYREPVTVVTVAYRATDARGREFVAAIVHDAAGFQPLVEQIASEATAEASILDGNGRVVATSGDRETRERAMIAAANGEDRVIEHDRHFVSSTPIEGTSWIAVMERPSSATATGTNDLRLVVWGIVLLALLAMVVLLLVLLRLARSLRRSQAMRDRHQNALEINDAVVQRLVAADLARELGQEDLALRLEREALAAAQALIGEMARDMRLRRSSAAGDGP